MSTAASRAYNWANDKTAGTPITAARMDTEFDAIITKLNQKVIIAASSPSGPIAGMLWLDSTNKLLKEYRNSEWVVHGPVHIGAAAPSTAQEGDCFFHTTNHTLQVYNGSAWVGVLVYPASTAQGDLVYLSAAETPARLAKDTNAKRVLMNTGTDNNPAWGQVDSAAASGVLGAWVNKSGGYGAQQAATDGFVMASFTVGASTALDVSGYSDSNANPTTLRAQSYTDGVHPSGATLNIFFAVKKGDYWKVTANAGSAAAVWWIPLGS